jgi:teichuronic acid biosynthesis glycosyltransferase TuaG
MVIRIDTMMLVDVVIPNFNRSLVLKDAIESVNRNCCINKIWLIDDGSDEEFTSFYDSLNYDNLQVIRHSRVSDPGYLRRIAITKSRAEWIAFLDSDDSWLDDKIFMQLKFAAKKKIDFVCSPAIERVGISDVVKEERVIKSNPISLLSSNYIITSSVLVKRELLLKIDFFCFGSEYKKCEDLGSWMRLSHFTNFGITREPLVRYNISQDSFGSNLGEGFRSQLLMSHLEWMFSSEKFRLASKISNFIFIICGETVRRTIFNIRRLKLRRMVRQIKILVRSNYDKD